MKRWMGPLMAAMAVVCLAVNAPAQQTTVSAAALGTSSSPLANGTIYWQPVNAAVAGGGGGQILGSARSATVTDGAFTLALPDTLAADPNFCYRVTAIDNTTGAPVLGRGFGSNGFDIVAGGAYGCVQPTGATWSFDTYVPPATPPVIYAPSATRLSTNGAANQVWGMDAAGAAQGWRTVSGSGIGTVNSAATGQLAFYAADGAAVSGTNALPNGTTASTQTPGDNSTKVATTAYVNAADTTGNAATATRMSTGGAANQVWGMDAAGSAQGWRTVNASGAGTVNSAATGQLAYYAADGTAVSGTNALPSGITATTQTAGDNSTKIATTAYADTAASAASLPAGVSGDGDSGLTVTKKIAAGTAVQAPTVQATADGVHNGKLELYGNSADATVSPNTVGFGGPNSGATGTAYRCNLPWTNPSAGQVLACGTPNAAGIANGTWVNPPTTQIIASGIARLGTGAIASGGQAAAVTVSAPGVVAQDMIRADFSADPTGTTGYAPSANGMLTIVKYPTANNVNFKVINNTAASITPGVATLNWSVERGPCVYPSAPQGMLWAQYPSNLAYGTWSQSNATATTQSFLALDCTANGVLLTEDSATGVEHYLISSSMAHTFASGQVVTYENWFRQAVGDRGAQMQLSGAGFANTASIGVKLPDCTMLYQNFSGSFSAPPAGYSTYTLTKVAGGWCKVDLTFQMPSGDSAYYIDFNPILNTGAKSYDGDGASGIAVWGTNVTVNQ